MIISKWAVKKKIYNWLFKKAIKVIAINIAKYSNQLTPEYLLNRGWVEKDGYYSQPNVKEKYKLYIRFAHHHYIVHHGSKMIPITEESSVEWFEIFYLLYDRESRYLLAGV